MLRSEGEPVNYNKPESFLAEIVEMPIKPIPEGFHTVTPYIMVKDAEGYINFLKKAFGAVEKSRVIKEGRIAHAGLQMGDSQIMLAESCDEGPWAKDWFATPVTLYLYVEDSDALYNRAVEAGAQSILALSEQPYGDRMGCVKDAWGNKWCIATHIEDVSDKETERRFAGQGA